MTHVWETFLTSFVIDLVAMSVRGLKFHMVVIMKALLLLYSIKLPTIHEAYNAKELCVLENSTLSGQSFFVYGSRWPVPGELAHNRIELRIYEKLKASYID